MADALPIGFPARRAEFVKLPPSEFKVVVRTCMGFTAQDIASEQGLSLSAISNYKSNARKKLVGELGTMDQLRILFCQTYAPELWASDDWQDDNTRERDINPRTGEPWPN